MVSAAVSGCRRGIQNILVLYLNWQGLLYWEFLLSQWEPGDTAVKPRSQECPAKWTLSTSFISATGNFLLLVLFFLSVQCPVWIKLPGYMMSFIGDRFFISSFDIYQGLDGVGHIFLDSGKLLALLPAWYAGTEADGSKLVNVKMDEDPTESGYIKGNDSYSITEVMCTAENTSQISLPLKFNPLFSYPNISCLWLSLCL